MYKYTLWYYIGEDGDIIYQAIFPYGNGAKKPSDGVLYTHESSYLGYDDFVRSKVSQPPKERKIHRVK